MADDEKLPALDTDHGRILGRLDRSSLDSLAASVAIELQRLNDACATMAARLSAAEVMQSYYHRVVPDEPGPDPTRLPRSVTLDAAFYLAPSWGFHAIEYDRTGAAFRWTGPEPTFLFELFVDRSESLRVTLDYTAIFSTRPTEELQCFADGLPLETSVEKTAAGFVFTAILPPREDPGATLLMFICPRVESPAETGRGGDPRRLGLMFRQLRVAPAGAPG